MFWVSEYLGNLRYSFFQSGDKSLKWAHSFKIAILQDQSFETQFTRKSTDNKTCICDIFTLVEKEYHLAFSLWFAKKTSNSSVYCIIGPRQANLCLRAFRHDKFHLRMPNHSEGPGIWFSVWRFLLTQCLYERAVEVLARFLVWMLQ